MFNVVRYPANKLARLIRRRKIATMPELMTVLGTQVEMTVFRKLRELSYRTSYSHGSRYYTLEEIAEFDSQGLWSCRLVWFSRYGTLLNTLEAFVEGSRMGCFSHELREQLHVEVKESLLRLVRQGRVTREEVSGLYLYCSRVATRHQKQLASRQALESVVAREGAEILSDDVKAAIVLFASLLDEKQRRLYAGLEALKRGRGGDRHIATLLGIHPHTVARGREELMTRDVIVERTRRVGAGRKPLEKKHPK